MMPEPITQIGGSGEKYPGAFAVVSIRFESLKNAISERDWNEVEFQYDRVTRALDRAIQMQLELAKDELTSDPRAGDGIWQDAKTCYRGTWNPTFTYEYADVVLFRNLCYFCLVGQLNDTERPDSDTSRWEQIPHERS